MSNKEGSLVQKVLEEQQSRQTGYRERALKMFPWICAHCGREFEGKRVKELTVHHKDHNHDNNPPDGSNWELLCIYCHDNEHSRDQVADAAQLHVAVGVGRRVREDHLAALGHDPQVGSLLLLAGTGVVMFVMALLCVERARD